MPLIQVKVIENVFTESQKREMVQKLTDAMVSIEGENMRPVTWVIIDAIRGHVSISGACVGPIIGLVSVTPAAGFVQPGWALFIGVITTAIIYGLLRLKKYMRVDDTLDVALIHGCGESDPKLFVRL